MKSTSHLIVILSVLFALPTMAKESCNISVKNIIAQDAVAEVLKLKGYTPVLSEDAPLHISSDTVGFAKFECNGGNEYSEVKVYAAISNRENEVLDSVVVVDQMSQSYNLFLKTKSRPVCADAVGAALSAVARLKSCSELQN